MAGGLIPRDQTEQVADLYRRLRKLGVATSGGFNPNADPIIIGAGADATETDSISIGTGASVPAGSSSIAIGSSANGYGDGVTAVGIGTIAAGYHSAAFGYGATVGNTAHDYSVAIGAGASTTDAAQIMLGSTTYNHYVEIPGRGLVLKDTATGTRYLVQITSGALVLNTAP